MPDGFAESYTLAGCSIPDHCGVFTRVSAQCTLGDKLPGHNDAQCPGGRDARPGVPTDPSLCDGVPVYQRVGANDDDGEQPVLYRHYFSGGTKWVVRDSTTLTDCAGHYLYLVSASNPGPTGDAPIAAVYSSGEQGFGGEGWYENGDSLDGSLNGANNPAITVVAGGGK